LRFSKKRFVKAVEKNIVTYTTGSSATAVLKSQSQKVGAIPVGNVFELWNLDKAGDVFPKTEQAPRLVNISEMITDDCAENRASAQALINFLTSSEGRTIFVKYGYPASGKGCRKHAP